MGISGHILDPYCVRLLNAAPFCENYMKLWCNAKHLEKELNRGGGRMVKILVHFFHKKSALFPQYWMLSKFQEYALYIKTHGPQPPEPLYFIENNYL